MALEFICAESVEHGKKIVIPMGADCYRLRSGRIKFFEHCSNGEKKIPRNSRYISFDIERNVYNIAYGRPSFYDVQGNDLNMGDNS